MIDYIKIYESIYQRLAVESLSVRDILSEWMLNKEIDKLVNNGILQLLESYISTEVLPASIIRAFYGMNASQITILVNEFVKEGSYDYFTSFLIFSDPIIRRETIEA
jgi:Mg2+ and Co2+ transporter CorA